MFYNCVVPQFNIATYAVLQLKLLSGEGHAWHGVGNGQRAHGEMAYDHEVDGGEGAQETPNHPNQLVFKPKK